MDTNTPAGATPEAALLGQIRTDVRQAAELYQRM